MAIPTTLVELNVVPFKEFIVRVRLNEILP
jgi:hypothetical protein